VVAVEIMNQEADTTYLVDLVVAELEPDHINLDQTV
jgi:hypothetical protein